MKKTNDSTSTSKQLRYLIDNTATKIAHNNMSLDEFKDELINNEIILNEKSISLFLLESVVEHLCGFSCETPIRYYNDEDEFINDKSSVNVDDLEFLNDEYVSEINR